VFVSLNCVEESQAGEKWKALFEKTWPYYKKWFLRSGARSRPGYLTSYSKLKEAMPELIPVYERLSELAGGGDMVSRYLSLYNPPPFMSGCTQVAWIQTEPALIRNYDYSPKLFEGVLFKTDWLKPVMGVSDCNWGLLDGINGDGLSLSLTFGGRKIVGKGFGIPLIMRYVLETCVDVETAVEAFKVIPCHMVYNITILDRHGNYKTLFLGPDREIGIRNSALCTNHQELIDWPEYAAKTGTQERETELLNYLHYENPGNQKLINKFLHPPLYSVRPEESYATLYTAAYYPQRKSVEFYWPGKYLAQSLEGFEEKKLMIRLGKSISGKLTL
jgi:predicted choloylglycine hydrolase